MGIHNLFKKVIQNARQGQPIRKEHVIHKNIQTPIESTLVHKYPVINKNEIFQFIKNVKFNRSDSNLAFNTEFFNLLKNRYNCGPILERYACSDSQKMSNCIHWFELDAVQNAERKTSVQYNYINYNINPVIFSLLSNRSLKSISTIDGETGFVFLDENNDDIAKFEKNNFERISSLKFDGELSELALEGSLYAKWEYSANETKKKAEEFVDAIIGQRYEDFKIYKTTDCWSGYLLGFFVAYFIFDEKNGEFWILSKDDYD